MARVDAQFTAEGVSRGQRVVEAVFAVVAKVFKLKSVVVREVLLGGERVEWMLFSFM